jgi:hypothetical protein
MCPTIPTFIVSKFEMSCVMLKKELFGF